METKIDDGGPAYPVITDRDGSGQQVGEHSGWQTGMTLRDAFAIHAPPLDIQRLNFQPVIRKRPERPEKPNGIEFQTALNCYYDSISDICEWPEGKTEIKGWQNTVVSLTPELKTKVEAFVIASKAYGIDMAAWFQKHAKQTIAQWPWFYADLVLAARKAVAHG